MTTFILWIGGAILAGLGITASFFRKGGVYNPIMVIKPSVAPEIEPSKTLPIKRTNTMLETFCGAIRDYEGAPGDLNYQLNNPGDCRPSPVGYLPMYEPVVIIDTDTDLKYPFHVGKFAKFPTYAIGWEYLCNLVHYTAINHPNETIAQFFANYAPSGDKNDPNLYAETVAKRCGVEVDKTLAELFA